MHADDSRGEDVQLTSLEEMEAHDGKFGATVTTLANGIPALTTTPTWTDVGAIVDESIGKLSQSINDTKRASRLGA
jgi:hypothetical protein